MDIEKFKVRLKNLIEENEYTQDKLAQKLGCSKSIISNYVNGHRTPDVASLEALADEFCVSTDYLLGRIDQQKINNSVIASETGLEEQAINNLRSFKHDPNICQLVSRIIGNEYFEFFIDGILLHICVLTNKEYLTKLKEGIKCAGDAGGSYFTSADFVAKSITRNLIELFSLQNNHYLEFILKDCVKAVERGEFIIKERPSKKTKILIEKE